MAYLCLDRTRVKNILVIVYMAHKIRVKLLWQRFLNSNILKSLLKSIYNQYAKHTSHKFFEMCTRTVGNLALKRIWKAFIQAKVEYLSFEKIQEIIYEDNVREKKELNEFYAQMKELDKEAKTTTSPEITERDTEQINTISAEEIVSPISVEEQMISPHAATIKDSFSL